MNIKGYNIFINLLCFNFRSSQNSYFVQIFFPRYKKSVFLYNNIKEGYSPKWKTKKQNKKRITKSIKNNCKKDHKSIVKTFLKMRKLKTEKKRRKKIQMKIKKGKYKI